MVCLLRERKARGARRVSPREWLKRPNKSYAADGLGTAGGPALHRVVSDTRSAHPRRPVVRPAVRAQTDNGGKTRKSDCSKTARRPKLPRLFSANQERAKKLGIPNYVFLPIRDNFSLSAGGASFPILRALLVFRRRTLNPKP